MKANSRNKGNGKTYLGCFGNLDGTRFAINPPPIPNEQFYDALSLPYQYDPSMYKLFIWDCENFMGIVDAIIKIDLEKFEDIIGTNGVEYLGGRKCILNMMNNYKMNFDEKYIKEFLVNEMKINETSAVKYKYGLQGVVAPAYNHRGGAQQIKFPYTGEQLIDMGVLKIIKYRPFRP